jgi:hypothetical protein
MPDPTDNDTRDGEEDEIDLPPDPSITKELFEQWRAPRRGTSNPEPSNNPVWEWLIRCRWNAWRASQHFQCPSACEFGPGWCFDRFGQTKTSLTDGRTVHIAGEHEDHYDPDFFIYNDVVVQHPNGVLEIFNYPVEAFPPTDFHTASLVGNQIIIIGNLGYDEERQPGTTPVFVLNLTNFEISRSETSGTSPGWLFKHWATLSADCRSIVVSGGKIQSADGHGRENIDDWVLHLEDFRWEKLTDRKWQQFRLVRKDGGRFHLFEIQMAVWSRQIPFHDPGKDRLGELTREFGTEPDLDLFPRLYTPNLPHESIPDDGNEFGIHRIRIDGIVVKYHEGMHWIHVTIEGELSSETVAALQSDLQQKLCALENATCEWIHL